LSDREATKQELLDRLFKTEESLRQCEQVAIAGRYAVAVMHEVNNPLAAINNLIYLVKKEAHNAENVRRYMHLAEEELKRLSEITRKTLSFHRTEVQPKECDLVKIVEAALLIHSHHLSVRSVAVQTEFGQPVIAPVFEGEILQVISNFILNALDALPAKNAQLRCRVKASRERAHIVIADNGSGIHPSMHKRLFDPYSTTKKEGTGIGLWVSKHIIDKHRGTIRFRTSQQSGRAGTAFRISLPLARTERLVA
jgi:signal transduction histidine kinase